MTVIQWRSMCQRLRVEKFILEMAFDFIILEAGNVPVRIIGEVGVCVGMRFNVLKLCTYEVMIDILMKLLR